MAITVECTDCHATYSVAEGYAGKRVKCTKCGNTFTVPAGSDFYEPLPTSGPEETNPFDSGGANLYAMAANPPPAPRPQSAPASANRSAAATAPSRGTVYQPNLAAAKKPAAESKLPPAAWMSGAVVILAIAAFALPAPYSYIAIVLLILAAVFAFYARVSRAMSGSVYQRGGIGISVIVLLRFVLLGLRLAHNYDNRGHTSGSDIYDNQNRPPVAAPVFSSAGANGVVRLEILSDGTEDMRNRIIQQLQPRLDAAGIGVSDSAPMTIRAGIVRRGSYSMNFTPAESNFDARPHRIFMDKLEARISLIDASGRIASSQTAPVAPLTKFRFNTHGDEAGTLHAIAWDEGLKALDSLSLPTLPGSSSPTAAVPSLAAPTPAPQPTAPAVHHPAELAGIRDELNAAMATQPAGTSREAVTASFAGLIDRARALKSAYPGDPDCDLSDSINQLQKLIASFPSARPDNAIYQEPYFPVTSSLAPGSTAVSGLGDEVTFKGIAFRAPAEMIPDLANSHIGENLNVWRTHEGESLFSVQSVKRTNPAQKQPWVVTTDSAAALARSKGIFALRAADGSTISQGQVGGVYLTRAALPDGTGDVQYATLDGANWLVITVHQGSSPVVWEATETAIRRLRDGEPRNDLLSIQNLVAHLSTYGDAAVTRLGKYGAAAEKAVLPLLTQGDQNAVYAANVLAQIGSTNSIEPLKTAFRSGQPGLSAAARDALRKLAPKQFDPIGLALLDLDGPTPDFAKSLQWLAAGPADDQRRPDIEARLEKMFISPPADEASNVGLALATWRTTQTNQMILEKLNDPQTAKDQVVAAMAYAGAARDRTIIFPVVRWINTPYGDDSVNALVAMGPMVETEVIKVLQVDDDTAKANAARVLGKVGTNRSAAVLAALASNSRYPAAAEAARLARNELRSRPQTRPAKAQ